MSREVSTTDVIVMKLMIELESLFGHLFDEYFNGANQVVSKSSAVTTADASDKRQQQPDLTLSTLTLVTTVTADGNFDLFRRRCCNLIPVKSDSLTTCSYSSFQSQRSTSRPLILNFSTTKEPQTQDDLEHQIKMIQVKEMMQDKDLKNSKSKDKGSRSRPRGMNEQRLYKQDKTKKRRSSNVISSTLGRSKKTLTLRKIKYNQKEVDDLRVEQLAKSHDPLALMANSNNPFNYPVFNQDQPSSSTYMQQPLPNNNNYNPQPSFNQNYMQQPMLNPEDITDPSTAMNMTLVLMAKEFKLNYSTPTNNNQIISSNPHNRQIAQPGMNMGQDRQMQMVRGIGGNQFRKNQNGLIVVLRIANQNRNGNGNVVAARAEGNVIGNNGNPIRCYNCRGLGHLARNCTVRPRRRDDAYLQTQLLIAQKEEAII
ncbi:integrase, catalytic region, zinc finger, CCHC-type containing protein [Tanacetum coccineum]